MLLRIIEGHSVDDLNSMAARRMNIDGKSGEFIDWVRFRC